MLKTTTNARKRSNLLLTRKERDGMKLRDGLGLVWWEERPL